MKQVQDLIDTLTLNVQQVLNRVDIVLIPFEFETFVATDQFENRLSLLGRLKHIPVQQVVDFLVVELEEGDIDGDAAVLRILR